MKACPSGFLLVTCFALLACSSAIDRTPILRHKTNSSPDLGPVCAVLGGAVKTTFPSAEAAHQHNASIMHCGSCGSCSTDDDINIYRKTRNSLTRTTTLCALWALVPYFGDGRVESCMNEHVGFTNDCNQCWLENIRCSRRQCAGVCAGYFLKKKVCCFISFLSSFQVGGLYHHVSGGNKSEPDDPNKLNQCLACDEEKCGPGTANMP